MGQRPPKEFCEPAEREYPERLRAQRAYPDDWEKRMVRKGGQMKWKGKDIRLTSALWEQEIGLKPVADGEWAVYFESLELGIFDERTGRMRPAKRLNMTPTNEK